MILKMNTNILPLVNPGLYGTILGSFYEDVPIEDSNDFKELLCEKGMESMNELLKDEEAITNVFGQMKVSNVTLYSPMFYNFKNDEFDFDLEVPDDITQRILNDIEEPFYDYIAKRFGSRSGFVSYMPYEKENYIKAIQGKDLERSVAMYIIYLTEHGDMTYPLETYQREFEDEMNDACFVNGWYEYDDYDMEE